MSQILTRRRREGGGEIYYHMCPGCGQAHGIHVGVSRPNWTFNGDEQKPTFSPSVRCLGGPTGTLCHYFIKAGQIEYCSDSPHELAGKTVPLPPLPDWLMDEHEE